MNHRVGTLPDRLRYLVVLSRPRFWLYLLGPVLVGAVYGAATTSDLTATSVLVLAGYFLLPANVLLYGVNDVFDADIDAVNPRKESGDARETHWQSDPLVSAAIFVSGLLGLLTFWVSPQVAWPYLGGFFALAIAYSAPPLRLKTVPLLDSLSNGLYILPGAAAYASLAGAHPPLFALFGAWLWTMGMHTFSAIPDIDADRRAGIRTTATVLGERRTYWYCGTAWTLAWLAFTGIDIRLGVPFLVYPLLVTVIARDEIPVSRAYWWFPALNAGVGALITIGGLVLLRSATGGILP